MAYIPPHKRKSKNRERPLPTPELLVPQVKRSLNLRPSRSNLNSYAEHAISRWFIIGLNEDNQLPCFLQVDKLMSLKGTGGDKEFQFFGKSCLDEENNQVRENILRSPWVAIAENVQQDLLSSFENVRKEMECQELEKVKPTLLARFGKIVYHGSPSPGLQSVERSQVAETTSRQMKKALHTNIPTSYMENIIGGVAPTIGIDFEEKESYRVWLHDRIREACVVCKCRVEHDKKLEPYKFELRQVRHMVVDILCLDKDLDLRLMLCTKRILTALNDDEKHCIRDLIRSADLESSVKGGLRWPLGKDTSGSRFRVVEVEHLMVKAYSSPSLRLKLIHADRYNFGASTGQVTREIDLKLKKVLSDLWKKVEINSISDTLKDNLRMIWDHFLL